MIGVLIATEWEAKPLLTRLDAVRISDSDVPTYRATLDSITLRIAISGMGMDAAADACRELIDTHRVKAIVNLGICGGLSDDLSIGAIMTAHEVRNLDIPDERNNATSPWPGLKVARLGSVAKPVFDDSRRQELATECELVDMEGAAVARACAERNTPCFLLKGVTDGAGDGGRHDLHRHLTPVADALAERFCQDAEGMFNKESSGAEKLLSFTRVEHTIFSIPLLFAGAWLGADGGMPSISTLALIILAGTGARTFGMAMNRILDRDIDARNPRTAGRELPGGRLSLAGAYAVAATGVALYLGGCAALGRLCFLLSPVPLIPLALYALLKRFTPLCHFGIGICLGAAPLGAYVATAGILPDDPKIFLLAGFALLWISGFDIIYALQDMESDRTNGVRSIPAALGSWGAQGVAALCHIAASAVLIALWMHMGRGVVAGLCVIVALGAFAAAYHPRVPLPMRFFPISAIAGIAGALAVILGGLV